MITMSGVLTGIVAAITWSVVTVAVMKASEVLVIKHKLPTWIYIVVGVAVALTMFVGKAFTVEAFHYIPTPKIPTIVA